MCKCDSTGEHFACTLTCAHHLINRRQLKARFFTYEVDYNWQVFRGDAARGPQKWPTILTLRLSRSCLHTDADRDAPHSPVHRAFGGCCCYSAYREWLPEEREPQRGFVFACASESETCIFRVNLACWRMGQRRNLIRCPTWSMKPSLAAATRCLSAYCVRYKIIQLPELFCLSGFCLILP